MLIRLTHVAVDGADTHTFYQADCDVRTFSNLLPAFRTEYAERLATAAHPNASAPAEGKSVPSPVGNEAVLALLGFLREQQIRTDLVTENPGVPDVKFCFSHSIPAVV